MPAMMSGLKRIPDSRQTSRHVRFVPRYDMARILHYIFCTEKALSDQRAFSTRTETP
jgi:hypothetical protein